MQSSFNFAIACTLVLAIPCAALAEGMFSKAQTDRGNRVFKENCAGCHGDHLEGGQHAPPLREDAFWGEWGGMPARSLYSRIISTMPPTDPGSLSERDVIDIVAAVVRANGVPAGAKNIEHADELNSLKLEQPEPRR
jgi:cytochrome c